MEVTAISYKRKPPINWMGCKTCLLQEILPRMPAKISGYCEVFGGSGALLFSVPVIGQEKEIYNDFNRDLFNFMMVLRYRPMAFLFSLFQFPIISAEEFEIMRHVNEPQSIRDIQEREDAERYVDALYNDCYAGEELTLCKDIVSAERYEELRREYAAKAELFDVKRAVVFYKKQRFSFGSGGRSFGGQPVNLKSYLKDILWCSQRLSRVVIQNKDFETVIRQYDAPDMFFYCDPPYHTTEGVYDVAFPQEDHSRLHDVLRSIQGKCMVSYNDDAFIRELYSDPPFRIIPVERANSLSNKPDAVFKELLILNYDPGADGAPEQLTLWEG